MLDVPSMNKVDLAAVRETLAGKKGPEYWRSLSEVAETEEFRQWLEDEFPNRAVSRMIDRRSFLKLMGASLALAGLTGCRNAFLKQGEIVPYVDQPENVTPGRALYFRTTMPRHGSGFGVQVRSVEGRPIKIEGNPLHPASRGSVDSIALASILNFYDPDRSRAVIHGNETESWEPFLDIARDAFHNSGGAGCRILTETVSSPTLATQISSLLKKYPGAEWHQFEPINRDAIYEGSHLAFGKALAPAYHLDRAEVVVAVDWDMMQPQWGDFSFARDLMLSRQVAPGKQGITKLYGVHSTPTLSSAVADSSLPMAPAQIHRFVSDLANGSSTDPWTRGVLNDLGGKTSAVVCGHFQPPEVQALVHQANARLGNVGKSVAYVAPSEARQENHFNSLRALVQDIDAGKVSFLLIFGGNPVYAAPGSLGFGDALARVPLSAHVSQYFDETSSRCSWHLPGNHYLESWGDAVGFDGTASVIQPLALPLYDSKSEIQVISELLGDLREPMDIVRATWGSRVGSLSADQWTAVLRDGAAAGTKFPEESPVANLRTPAPSPIQGLQIIVRPDPSVEDGAYANNGWLQELPNPHSSVVWDNTVMISPAMAERMKLQDGDHVSVVANGQTVQGPVAITPQHADGCATVYLGGGRTLGGNVAEGVGFNVYPLVDPSSPWLTQGSLTKTGGHTDLVMLHEHHGMEGRDIIHVFTLDSWEAMPELPPGPVDRTLYNQTAEWDKSFGRPQWGMVIDLSTCIGCNACVTACQAENNIPVVGKDQCRLGREMHWLRIDRYYADRAGTSSLDNPRTYFQPVPCMHCETAPCEPVCPVGATVHSHEGLNQMVYNRCVGTRYCSNNCPYKVRRFNWSNLQMQQPNFRRESDVPLLRLINNPDVSVRSRGVMEKCTYCVQRINEARIQAKEEERDIRDGEVVTACQQACPTAAIVFGDILDPDSAVTKLRTEKRMYSLLHDLNTRPRTTYLAKILNVPEGEI